MNKKIYSSLIIFFSLNMLTNEHLMSLNLPKNFEISIFANNIESPRQMAETKKWFCYCRLKKWTKYLCIT